VSLQEGEAAAEFLYRCSEEQLGVQSMVTLLLSEAISRIEQKHKCKAQLRFNVRDVPDHQKVARKT